MSTSNSRTSDHPETPAGGFCNHRKGSCGNWSGFNIAAMVIGFVIFWPIGLVLLFWVLKGRNIRELPSAIQHQWHRFKGTGTFGREANSDNDVFNHYQQTQYDRIDEIREEIKERSRRFGEFRSEAKRRADEAEFNQFMAGARSSGRSY